ncbi:AMMECR1 domain-containing protein, partial [Dysosmobacter welbionis]
HIQVPDVQGIIQRQVGQAPVQHIRYSLSGEDISLQPGPQGLRCADQGDGPQDIRLRQAAEQVFPDFPPVQDPAENHMVIGGAAEEAVQEKRDVLQHHLPGLLRHLKGVGIPAPVPVQEHAPVQQLLQLAAGGGLSHAHRTADHIQALHAPISGALSAQAWRRLKN